MKRFLRFVSLLMALLLMLTTISPFELRAEGETVEAESQDDTENRDSAEDSIRGYVDQQYAPSGSSVTLTFVLEGSDADISSYQWYFLDGSNNWVILEGETSNVFSTSDVSTKKYQIQVTDVNGYMDTFFTEVYWQNGPFDPSIYYINGGIEGERQIEYGSSTSLSAFVEDAYTYNLSYQWFEWMKPGVGEAGDGSWEKIKGATTTSLQVENVIEARSFKIEITSVDGFKVIWTADIHSVKDLSEHSISAGIDGNRVVEYGGSTVLNAFVDVSYANIASYQWYEWKMPDEVVIGNGYWELVSETYSVNIDNITKTRTFKVVITDVDGYQVELSTRVTSEDDLSFHYISGSIIGNWEVAYGEDTYFHAQVDESYTSIRSYQWYRWIETGAGESGEGMWEKLEDYTSTELFVENVTERRIFKIEITDDGGYMVTWTVNVYPGSGIPEQYINGTITGDKTVNYQGKTVLAFQRASSSSPITGYQWFTGIFSMEGMDDYQWTPIEGAVDSSCVFDKITSNLCVSVVVTCEDGYEERFVETISVNVASDNLVVEEFNGTPSLGTVYVESGGDAVLKVNASVKLGEVHFEWYKAVMVEDESEIRCDRQLLEGETSNTFVVKNVQKDMTGEDFNYWDYPYICIISDDYNHYDIRWFEIQVSDIVHITLNANGGYFDKTSQKTIEASVFAENNQDSYLTYLKAPDHANKNMLFMGWSKTKTGKRTSFDVSKLKDGATLYAVWKETQPLALGDKIEISITDSLGETLDDAVVFTFTPEEDGAYSFYSSNRKKGKPYGALYRYRSNKLEFMADDTNSGGTRTFKITEILEKGIKYVFFAANNSSEGQYSVNLRKVCLVNVTILTDIGYFRNGTRVVTKTYAEGKVHVNDLEIPSAPNDSAVFVGWTTAPYGTVVDATDEELTDGVILYAVWQDLSALPELTIGETVHIAATPELYRFTVPETGYYVLKITSDNTTQAAMSSTSSSTIVRDIYTSNHERVWGGVNDPNFQTDVYFFERGESYYVKADMSWHDVYSFDITIYKAVRIKLNANGEYIYTRYDNNQEEHVATHDYYAYVGEDLSAIGPFRCSDSNTGNWKRLVGWATKKTAEKPNVTEETAVKEGMTLYAIWQNNWDYFGMFDYVDGYWNYPVFTVNYNGSKPLKYWADDDAQFQWYRQRVFTNGAWQEVNELIDGATSDTYTPQKIKQSAFYQVKITLPNGYSTRERVQVLVNNELEAHATDNQDFFEITKGDNVTLSVDATTQRGSLYYTWEWMTGKQRVAFGGENSASLILHDVQHSYSEIRCIVGDDFGHQVTVSFSVDMNHIEAVAREPEVWVKKGKTAILTVDASADEGSLIYRWEVAGKTVVDQIGPTLTLENVTKEYDGNICCIVKDVYGISKSVTFTVHLGEKPPVYRYIVWDAAGNPVDENGGLTTFTIDGDAVTIIDSPDIGYHVESVGYCLTGEEEITDITETRTFTIPEGKKLCDYVVTTVFRPIREDEPRNIIIPTNTGGTVTADKTSAMPGETVTITVTLKSGYHLDALHWENGGPTGPSIIMERSFVMWERLEDVVVDAKITKGSHTKAVDAAVAATCTKSGLTEGSHCSVCGDVIAAQEVVPALGHSWGTPAWTWTETEDGGYTAVAKFTCTNDSKHTKKVTATVTSATTEPVDGVDGKTVYTAKAEFNGTTYTKKKTVTIIAKPYINTQPKAAKVVEGKTATFTVTATGTDLTYKWQYKKPDATSWTNISSNSTSASYTLTTAAKHDGYVYRCKVTNAAGTTISGTAELTVISLPEITTQPTAKKIVEGKKATFKVVAEGHDLTYQWQYHKAGATTWTNVKNNGTEASLSLTTKASHDGYVYRCKVTNKAGTVISGEAKLTVISVPAITTQPTAVSVAAGKKATFKVVATGNALSYQWQYKKPGSSTWTNVSSNGTSATYSLTTKASHNGYVYRCVVSNKAGTVNSSTAKLTVK